MRGSCSRPGQDRSRSTFSRRAATTTSRRMRTTTGSSTSSWRLSYERGDAPHRVVELLRVREDAVVTGALVVHGFDRFARRPQRRFEAARLLGRLKWRAAVG